MCIAMHVNTECNADFIDQLNINTKNYTIFVVIYTSKNLKFVLQNKDEYIKKRKQK